MTKKSYWIAAYFLPCSGIENVGFVLPVNASEKDAEELAQKHIQIPKAVNAEARDTFIEGLGPYTEMLLERLDWITAPVEMLHVLRVGGLDDFENLLGVVE